MKIHIVYQMMFFVESPHETIDKYFDLLKRGFEEMGHISHYNMMMNPVEKQFAITNFRSICE